MFRTVVLLSVMMALTATVMAADAGTGRHPMIGQGTRTLGLNASIDNDGEDFGGFAAGRAGYFLMDGVEAGALAGLGFRGSDYRMIELGGYGEYNFDMGMPVIPYVGGGAVVGWIDNGDSEAYLEVQAWGGAKYFFVDYAAIAGGLTLKAATEDFYNRGGDNFDWVLDLGLRWYF